MPTTKRGRCNKTKKTGRSSERLHERTLREAVSVLEGGAGPERIIQDEQLHRAIGWTAARGRNTETLQRLFLIIAGASGPNGDELEHGSDAAGPAADGTTAAVEQQHPSSSSGSREPAAADAAHIDGAVRSTTH